MVFGKPRGSGESIWSLKRRIGWVSPELHVHFPGAATCFEVAASGFRDTMGLFEPPTSRQRAAVRRWLERFQLLECAASPLFSLSAGLQRMVLLARALVKDPPLLILDEPCQGLDPAHRRCFVRVVNRLIRAGSVTVIYVTHRNDEIPPAIRRVLRLSRGRAWVEMSATSGKAGGLSSEPLKSAYIKPGARHRAPSPKLGIPPAPAICQISRYERRSRPVLDYESSFSD